MSEDLKPGRALDALVARQVMGYELSGSDGIKWPNKPHPESALDYSYCRLPPYSTDIKAAWHVVEKLDRPMGLTRYRKDFWYVEFFCIRADYPDREELPNIGFTAEAKTITHAICLAALKVLDHTNQAQQSEPKEKPESSCEPPG